MRAKKKPRSERIHDRIKRKFEKHRGNEKKYQGVIKAHNEYRDEVASTITDETTEKDLKKPNRKLSRMRAKASRIESRDRRLANRTERQLDRYEKVKKKGK
jgi:hypothetical protein